MSRQKRTGANRPSDSAARAVRQAWAPAVRQRVAQAVVEHRLPVEQVARTVGVG